MSIQVTYDKSSMIVTKIVKVPAGCHQLSKIDEDNLFGDDGDIFEEQNCIYIVGCISLK